jgi:hypothetical protein
MGGTRWSYYPRVGRRFRSESSGIPGRQSLLAARASDQPRDSRDAHPEQVSYSIGSTMNATVATLSTSVQPRWNANSLCCAG